MTAERLQELRTLGNAMALAGTLASHEHYEIPLLAEDGTVSQMRLTVKHEGGGTGRLELRMDFGVQEPGEAEEPGTVQERGGAEEPGTVRQSWESLYGQLELQGGVLTGTLECKSRQGLRQLEDRLPFIRSALGEAGLETGMISCGIRGNAGAVSGSIAMPGRVFHGGFAGGFVGRGSAVAAGDAGAENAAAGRSAVAARDAAAGRSSVAAGGSSVAAGDVAAGGSSVAAGDAATGGSAVAAGDVAAGDVAAGRSSVAAAPAVEDAGGPGRLKNLYMAARILVEAFRA